MEKKVERKENLEVVVTLVCAGEEWAKYTKNRTILCGFSYFILILRTFLRKCAQVYNACGRGCRVLRYISLVFPLVLWDRGRFTSPFVWAVFAVSNQV